MTEATFQFVFPLLALYCAVVAFLVYLLVKVPHAYKFKWAAVPVFLVASVFSYDVYLSKLGRAFPMDLPTEEFIIVKAQVVGKKEAIDMWIKEGKKTSRFIRIPYDEQTDKALQKAQEREKKTGIPQVGKKKSKGNVKSHGDDNAPDFQFYDFPFEREMPKDQPNNIPEPVTPQMPPAPSLPRDNMAPPPVAPQ